MAAATKVAAGAANCEPALGDFEGDSFEFASPERSIDCSGMGGASLEFFVVGAIGACCDGHTETGCAICCYRCCGAAERKSGFGCLCEGAGRTRGVEEANEPDIGGDDRR